MDEINRSIWDLSEKKKKKKIPVTTVNLINSKDAVMGASWSP